MKKKVKAMWLKALRSGGYKQGTTRLKCGDRFCCLGVLCDLHRKQLGKRWNRDDEYSGEAFVVPPVVMRWAGLIHDNPDCGDASLAAHNDGTPKTGKKSFTEIADLIEKNL